MKDAAADVSFVRPVNCGGGSGGAAICSGDIDVGLEELLLMLPSSTRRCGVAVASRKGDSWVDVTSAAPLIGLILRDCDAFWKLLGESEGEIGPGCDFSRDNRGLARFLLSVLASDGEVDDGELDSGDSCVLLTILAFCRVWAIAFGGLSAIAVCVSNLRLPVRGEATLISSSGSSFAGRRFFGIANRLKKSVMLRLLPSLLVFGGMAPIEGKVEHVAQVMTCSSMKL